MNTEIQNQSEPSIASLVSGIANDFQDLVKQQLRLVRQDIEADLRKSREAASCLALGVGLILIGAFAVCLMLGHLLHWLTAPAGADLSALPLWASFAIVGVVFLCAGGSSILAANKKMGGIANPLPNTAQALKENLEWKTKASPS